MLKNLAKQTGVKYVFIKMWHTIYYAQISQYKRDVGRTGDFHCFVKFSVYPCVEHSGRRKSKLNSDLILLTAEEIGLKRRYGKK